MNFLLLAKNRWAQLGALALVSAIAITLLWLRGNAWERTAETWELAHDKQKEAFASAVQAARLKAESARLRAENHYTELARSNDATLQELRGDVRLAAARYAAANRLRTQGDRSARGGPSAPAQGGDPGKPERPGPETELLAIQQRDFDILVDNTVRLEAAHRWAKTLNVEVPKPEFGGSE